MQGEPDFWTNQDKAQKTIQAQKTLNALLKPYEGPVNVRAVGRLVSNSKNDVPECLDDAEPTWEQGELL